MTAADKSVRNVASDAFEHLRGCQEILQQLEALMIALKDSAPQRSNQARLASLGAFVAMDHANVVDCFIEDYGQLLEVDREGID
ncbi:hypothetical protein [Pseudomonas sp. Fl4BN1]|uniref:hypothetical protein n=1 Tax=Pseudomonas sp. Fl4BN1 TaxID=2697651 RepID=UPI0013766149|nr:hypothetical protein [Pseudomonas sp. Fl4BN1]NBF08584.1 hypothetical protein [Pseudomonas sp. Fl4BN1]